MTDDTMTDDNIRDEAPETPAAPPRHRSFRLSRGSKVGSAIATLFLLWVFVVAPVMNGVSYSRQQQVTEEVQAQGPAAFVDGMGERTVSRVCRNLDDAAGQIGQEAANAQGLEQFEAIYADISIPESVPASLWPSAQAVFYELTSRCK